MRIKDQKRDGSMTIFVSLVMLIRSGAFSGIGCKGGYECDAVGRVGVCGISERDLGSV